MNTRKLHEAIVETLRLMRTVYRPEDLADELIDQRMLSYQHRELIIETARPITAEYYTYQQLADAICQEIEKGAHL